MLRLFCHRLEQSQPHPLNGRSTTFPEKGVLHSCRACSASRRLLLLKARLPSQSCSNDFPSGSDKSSDIHADKIGQMRIKDKITVPIHKVHRSKNMLKSSWVKMCPIQPLKAHLHKRNRLQTDPIMNQTILPMPVSPSGVSGKSACHFRNCWSSDELWIFLVRQATFKYRRAVQSPLYFVSLPFSPFSLHPVNPKP